MAEDTFYGLKMPSMSGPSLDLTNFSDSESYMTPDFAGYSLPQTSGFDFSALNLPSFNYQNPLELGSYDSLSSMLPSYTPYQSPRWTDQLSDRYNAVKNWGGWDDAKAASRNIGGLMSLASMGMGLADAYNQRGLRKEQMNMMRQQNARSNAAQDFALEQARKAAAARSLAEQQAAKRFAQKQAYKVALDPRGMLGYKDQAGTFSIDRPNVAPMQLAGGGLAALRGANTPRQSRPVTGPGTGQSDEIDAKLSDGEYVLDASTVSDLGDGSTKAGQKVLDGMVKKVRDHKRGGLGSLPPKAKKPDQYMKGAK